MERIVLEDVEQQSVVAYIELEPGAKPPHPIPYAIPMNPLVRIESGENTYGSIVTDFVGGFDSDIDSTCYAVWFSYGASQAQDDTERYFLGALAYFSENKAMDEWIESDLQEVFDRVFVYACVKAWVHDYDMGL